ncbi:MAG: class I SAM-dependent methyltransferase [Chloroflexi bacterium]|nr:class I SAM-dependent methyltransferase [Chloroflexota bacterium]
MPDRPQTWHYGLVARWWAEFNVATPELAFYQACIARFGQPALDVACGTGRLLLPLLQAGLDVDGCDLSPDMLARCHTEAARAGLTPRLYAQAMHALDLPRLYRTIYMCDSFAIGGRRRQDADALRCFYRYLEPGGALVFNHEFRDGDAEEWQEWAREKRHQLPEVWPSSGNRRQASDGSEIELRARRVDLDPIERRTTTQMRAALWREGQLVAEEEHTLQQTVHFRDEVLLMLEQAGFGDVTVYGGYTDAPATAEHQMVVCIARK